MAFKLRSQSSVKKGGFKSMGSTPLKMHEGKPHSEPTESVADPKEYDRQRQLEKESSIKPYTGKDPDPRDKEDSLLENVVEFVDPTGVSSWDDASRAYDKEDKGVVDYLDMAGAIPLAGKIGKIPRYAKQGFDLFKSGSKAAAATLGASRLLNFSDTASDIKEDNIKKK